MNSNAHEMGVRQTILFRMTIGWVMVAARAMIPWQIEIVSPRLHLDLHAPDDAVSVVDRAATLSAEAS